MSCFVWVSCSHLIFTAYIWRLNAICMVELISCFVCLYFCILLCTILCEDPAHRDADPQLVFEDMSVMSDFELHRLCLTNQVCTPLCGSLTCFVNVYVNLMLYNCVFRSCQVTPCYQMCSRTRGSSRSCHKSWMRWKSRCERSIRSFKIPYLFEQMPPLNSSYD